MTVRVPFIVSGEGLTELDLMIMMNNTSMNFFVASNINYKENANTRKQDKRKQTR